jgi:hypothetical protein
MGPAAPNERHPTAACGADLPAFYIPYIAAFKRDVNRALKVTDGGLFDTETLKWFYKLVTPIPASPDLSFGGM